MLDQIFYFISSGLSDFDFVNAFTAVFFLGESALIALVIAARQGLLELPIVVIAAIFATFMADLFWLLVGRYTPQDKLPQKLKKKVLGPINTLLAKLVDKNLFLTLVCLKFLITIRLPLLLHLSKYKVSWFRLLTYNLFGTLFFVTTLTFVAIRLETFITENLQAGQIIVITLASVAFLFMFSSLLLKALIRWTVNQ